MFDFNRDDIEGAIALEKMAFTFAIFNRYGSVFFPTESAATDALNKAKKQKLQIDGQTLEVTGTVKVILRSESRQKNGMHSNFS